MANDERGKHWWSKSIKSVEDHYENEEARWANKGKQWVDDSKTIMQVAESFNAAVPRANQMFVSLGRLEAMQDMLGVSDPLAMNTAVVASLKQAHEIADREKTTGDGGLDVPQANEKVTSSAEEVNGAQKMMNATWIGVQKKLLMATGTKIRAEGADAEKRQAEINKNIEFISNVGKTIDLSMSVMSGGKTMLEGTSSTLSKSQLDDLIADESASVMDTSGVDAAKAGGKKAASMAAQSVGLEIPTDVSSALETAGKIYYWRELETIRKKLTDLRNAAGKYEEVAKGLDMEKDIATYEAAVTQFEVAAKKQRDAVTARREAYLKFGAQIDKAAQNDPKALAKGQAPGKGQERFATVMAVTAAVRETLAMGNGALAGFGYSPNQIGEVWKSAKRNRLPLGWPDEEYEAVRSMHVQLLSFKGNVKGLNEMLGPIEKAAQSMMHDLAGGEEGAKPGGKDDKGQY